MKIRITIVLLLIALAYRSSAQHERGLLPIQNFTSKDYESVSQNWCVTQGKNGAIYIGNNLGLLEFRGANSKDEKWRLHKVDNASNIRSICVDEKGHVFVGAREEFGYFAPDTFNRGELKYYSLLPYVDSTHVIEGEIWHTCRSKDGVYFGSNKYIYYWNGKSIQIIGSEQIGNGSIREIFNLNGKNYIICNSLGVAGLNDGKVVKLRGGASALYTKEGEDFTRSMVNEFAQIDDNSGILFSKNTPHSLVTIRIENNAVSFTPFSTQANGYIKKNGIADIHRANDCFVFSTTRAGILVLDLEGRILKVLDKQSGLQNELVRQTFLDDQNFLWAATNAGVDRIDLFSRYMRFPPQQTGFEERIERVVRYQGRIYISGYRGLYRLDQNVDDLNAITDSLDDLKAYSLSSFTPVVHELLPAKRSVWGMKKINVADRELLLISTDFNTLEINEKGEMREIIKDGPWCFHVDQRDSARVFAGLYQRGVGSFYFDGKDWVVEGRIGDLKKNVLNIAQDKEGNLWMGSNNGTYRLDAPNFVNHKVVDAKITVYDYKKGLPKHDAIYNLNYQGEVLFGSGEGLYTYDADKDTFLSVTHMGEWLSEKHVVHRMAEGLNGELWAVVFSEDKKFTYLARIAKDEQGQFSTNRLFVNESEVIMAMLPEEDNVVWIGSTNGVFRILYEEPTDEKLPFRTYINYVISNTDTIFNGLFYNEEGIVEITQSSNLRPTVEYSENTFEFVISSIGYHNEVPLSYSYFLDGDDEDWTLWSDKSSRRYSNLHEGEYTLHVKAKDIFGNISEVATYSFSVKPPWYRTIVAFILYVLLFAAFVYGAVTVSTRSLRRIIREATAEIRAQKDELEEKNNNILDSIRYAQRIQEAVLPSENKLRRHFPEHFVLFKPRDIVSGDFYWMMNKGEKNIIVAADCTGHGVPGAFMSIMGVSFLNEIANNKDVQTAAEALNQLRFNVINSLNQEESEEKAKDGMDLSMCVYDFDSMKMQFAGAYNHLYRVRNGEFDTIKADRMPIGVHSRDNKPFTNQEIDIQKEDVYYILSDGYIDQFGGEQGKKFMGKRFKKLILEIWDRPMDEQRRILEEENLKWRGDIEQLDDIIVIGIKIV